MRALRLSLAAFGVVASTAALADSYDVTRGDPARRALLDTVRPAVEIDVQGPVEFVVDDLRREGEWAFFAGGMQHPGGVPIVCPRTRFADECDFMDGFSVFALLREEGPRWRLVDLMVGPTDVGWADWPERHGAPCRLMPSRPDMHGNGTVGIDAMDTLNDWPCHGGRQLVVRHASEVTGTGMTFGLFLPPGEGPHPLIVYLSGLTCTHANAMEKGEYRAACAAHGIAFLTPDTSPRGEGVADDEAYDLGQGAGFYVDATREPWAPHFQMRNYIEGLPTLVAERFPVRAERMGIMGHSMGGHGALTIGLTNPAFVSVSAFAPICAPSRVPWGEKAFGAYLGGGPADWRAHDATAIIEDAANATALPPMLVHQGEDDQFLRQQLRPDLLREAADRHNAALDLRMVPGDHSLLHDLDPHGRACGLACGADGVRLVGSLVAFDRVGKDLVHPLVERNTPRACDLGHFPIGLGEPPRSSTVPPMNWTMGLHVAPLDIGPDRLGEDGRERSIMLAHDKLLLGASIVHDKLRTVTVSGVIMISHSASQ